MSSPFPQVWVDTAHTNSSPPPLSPSYSRNAAKSTREIITLHNYYLYSQFLVSIQSQYLKIEVLDTCDYLQSTSHTESSDPHP